MTEELYSGLVDLAGDASEFSRFTFPRYAQMLSDIEAPLIAIGYRMRGSPVGLLLGLIDHNQPAALLHSVSVSQPRRGQGIGKALLARFEERALDAGMAFLRVRYAGRTQAKAALEAVLRSRGWEPPTLDELSLIGEAGKMAAIGGEWPGVRSMLRNPGTISFEPWRPLSDDDLLDVVRLRDQTSYGPALDFRPFLDRLDPVCSLQVRQSGRLVGWIVATDPPATSQLLSPWKERVRRWYSVAYIDEAFWRRGTLIAGYHHAFSQQGEAYGTASIAHYFTCLPGQMALTRRRFAPIALAMDEIFRCQKQLREKT